MPGCSAPTTGVEVRGNGGYIIVPPSHGYSVAKDREPVNAPDALIQRLERARKAFNSSSVRELEARILEGSSYHEALTMIAAKRHGKGDDPTDIQADLTRIMNASVGANPQHKRHDRWASIMKGDELGRICGSAQRKYNPKHKDDVTRETFVEKLPKGYAAPEGLFTITGSTGGQTVATNKDGSAKAGTEKKAEKARKSVREESKSSGTSSDEFPFRRAYAASKVDALDDKNFLIFPLIMESDVVLLSADPKAGKTLTAMGLCLHAAAGLPMGDGRLVPLDRDGKPAKITVIYFALEGQGAIRKRIRAWLKYASEKYERKFTEEDLHIYVIEEPANLSDEEERQDIVDKLLLANEYVKAQGWAPIGLVVFDTLTKTMPGGDQNSVTDTSAVFQTIDMLREAHMSSAVMFIHHNNQQGGRPRGSSNIVAEPDTILSIVKAGKRVVGDQECEIASLSVYMARAVDDSQKYDFAMRSIELGENRQGIIDRAPIVTLLQDRQEYDTVSESKLRKAMGAGVDDFYIMVSDAVSAEQGMSCHVLHRLFGSKRVSDGARAFYVSKLKGNTFEKIIATWAELLQKKNLPPSIEGVGFNVGSDGHVSIKIEAAKVSRG